jgi:hypothetical protein
MEKDNLPGLSPLWLILLATLLGAFLPIMIAATMSADAIKPADWLGFSGSILTTGVAAAAIYYAWKGIIRQLRIGLISREEDRIERDLPGLRDAIQKVAEMAWNLHASDLADMKYRLKPYGIVLEEDGIDSDTLDIRSKIEKFLPRTDDYTKRRLTGILERYRSTGEILQWNERRLQTAKDYLSYIEEAPPEGRDIIRQEFAEAEEARDKQWIVVRGAHEPIEAFVKELASRVDLMEARLPRLRGEIEAFFDR